MTTPNDPPPQRPNDPPGTPAGPPDPDPLDALRNRIRSTQDAVERLADEAARAARAPHENPGPSADDPGRPPPSGYAVPGDDAGYQTAREAQALVALVDLVRGLIPRELAEQLVELVRELLLLVRSLIDWYLERLEQRRRPPLEVEDIPIT